MPGKSLENMHVAVLAGGHSAEREISLNSGKNVVVALKEAGYTSVELPDTAADDFMVTMATGGFDVAFIAMHGAGGEEGAMQGAQEGLGIPYPASAGVATPCGALRAGQGEPLHGLGRACQRLRCRQGGL